MDIVNTSRYAVTTGRAAVKSQGFLKSHSSTGKTDSIAKRLLPTPRDFAKIRAVILAHGTHAKPARPPGKPADTLPPASI